LAPRKPPTKTIRSQDTASIDDPATRYAEAVAHGRIVAGPYVRAACKRHLRDLEEGAARGLKFDLEKAQYALEFFPTVLRLNGGQFENKPFKLEPPQEFIVGSLFGWVRSDGTRRFRLAYIEEGKGNGKSPLVAGIGVIGLVADNEPRAEVYSAASKKDQAMILFRDAVAMVNQSPALFKRIKQSGRDDHVWNLFDEKTNSFFRPISADDGQSGPRPHIGLIDELHEHKNATVMNMMAAGQKWRRQPMVIAITNSGTDRKSVCYEHREKGIKVASGVEMDDTFFAYICALDEGEDPFSDEACWIKANPLMGTVITEQYLRDQVNNARGMPSKESLVRRLNFCQWVEAHNPAISYEAWLDAKASYSLEDFRGMSCVAGIDLSATTDLTSVVLGFQKDGLTWLWPMFWIPADGLSERVRRDGVPYDLWVKNGHVYTTPGAAIDKDFVVQKLAELLGKYDITISAAPYDRHRIDVLTAACNRVGVKWPLEPFGQGFVSMSPAWEAFETSLVMRTMRQPDNPCMNNNAANAVIVQDAAGNQKLDKSKATGRIDGVVAGAMVMGVLAGKGKEQKKYQFFVV
jgi:phage terminase large subunit-like protein